MKIGITADTFDTRGYGRWRDDTYIKLKRHGFSCSDFDMSNTDSEIYTLPQADSDKLLIKEKKLAEKAGIEISQVHGPWRWPVQDSTEEDRAERMEKMKKSIRATYVLGCKNWVIHPIMPYGIEDANTDAAQSTWDMNIAFMRELLQTAKEYDITICLENMPMLNFSISKPEDILRFAEEINDENFKICLDTGHVSVFKELSLYHEVLRLGKKIRTLHVHDNRNSLDLHMAPYYGIINWDEFALALKEIGFNGSFSLETLPSRKLPDDIFENTCKIYASIAKNICNE